MERAKHISAWAAAFTAVTGAGALVYSGYNKVPVPASIKTFHADAMEPIQVQMNRSEGKITALTIPPLLRVVCDNPSNNNMRELLLERVQEYERLLQRQYQLPDLDTCATPTPIGIEQ